MYFLELPQIIQTTRLPILRLHQASLNAHFMSANISSRSHEALKNVLTLKTLEHEIRLCFQHERIALNDAAYALLILQQQANVIGDRGECSGTDPVP